MHQTPDFTKPPIIEFVLGVQFAPLVNMTTGHFGLFWDKLGREAWPHVGDEPPLDPQFELFDKPRWNVPRQMQFRLKPGFQPGRFTLQNPKKDRMIQLQDTRLLLNWRRTTEGQVKYPSYKTLIRDFEETFELLGGFAEENNLGSLQPNQWEITYVDSFPQSEHWQTPADWHSVLPGLFGTISATQDSGLQLEHRAAEWSLEIAPKLGRLHINAQLGFLPECSQSSLLLNLTARGPVGPPGKASLREGLDLGHRVSVKEFLGMVSKQVQTTWEEKQ